MSVTAEPLHDAVDKGTVTEVKGLIDQGADVNTKDEKGNTPLHFPAILKLIKSRNVKVPSTAKGR